ncbi:MAG: hypothetical protein ACODAQ_04065 [Phycisphaeraceae bacterium]
MTVSDAYTQLVEAVQDTRRAWRGRRILEGALLTGAVAIGAALLATMIDHALGLSVPGRCVLAALMWLAVGVTIHRAIVRRALQAHSDDYFAALLEQRVPGLGNRLINALQLGRSANGAPTRLVEAIVSDGVHATDELDPGAAVRSPALRRHALALGVVATLAASYGLMAGPAGQTAMLRVLLPVADVAPFTWTRLAPQGVTLDPGDRLLEGEPLTVTLHTTGRAPDAAHLHWATTDGRARSARMEAQDEHTFEHTISAVRTKLSLHATAGDLRTEPREIVVDPLPRIEQIRVVYDYPAYTGRENRTINDADGHLHGLPQTRAALTWFSFKPLAALTVRTESDEIEASPLDEHGHEWQAALTLTESGPYRVHLRDTQGYERTASTTYTITIENDEPPYIAFAQPGRDVQRRPDGELTFAVTAQDDHGLGPVQLLGVINDADEARTLHAWPNDGEPARQRTMTLERTIEQLGLSGGDELTYWAEAVDRNDVTGPGHSATRRFHVTVLTDEQARARFEQQLGAYAEVVAQLIAQQKRNRAETAEFEAAAALIERQSLIRRKTQQLAEIMQRESFPATTIIDSLRTLAAEPMAEVIATLESYRDAQDLDAGRPFAQRSLSVQDEIVAELERILLRLNRAEQTRRRLKKKQESEPNTYQTVERTLDDLSRKLDEFLSDVRELEEQYEKLPKRGDRDTVDGESLDALADLEQQRAEWEQWFKDSVDAITQLPDGFIPEAHLAENVNTIFEEVEKQPRSATREIATPVEEGIKALAEEVADDLEMWMPHEGDSQRWVMESPPEGTFDVPEEELPSQLQDRIGELIEEADEFDEQADDVTGAWGGNMQMGWDIADGPISSFNARGKTGNQLPNASEMSGRSGSGRRGRASGQMVGAESRALEGRPTPARVTNEPYEEGMPEADEQLDPHGATGGGKKTGGGQRGLQGGTPPDFVKDMQRLADRQRMLRERAQQVAGELNQRGRPLSQVHRAVELMSEAERDLRDLRYQDAARKRKAAIGALRAAGSGVDRAVNLSLQRARHLPAEMRDEISSGAQQQLPEGYEAIVGAYYKALSENADE